LAAFAQFASDLDAATKAQIDRGIRVTELMKQNQYAPLSVPQMSISLFAANEGFIDAVDVDKVLDFEAALHGFMEREKADLVAAIGDEGHYNDEIIADLKSSIEEFVNTQTW
jgi:F-type H+-transporting ATPase subunit alpha